MLRLDYRLREVGKPQRPLRSHPSDELPLELSHPSWRWSLIPTVHLCTVSCTSCAQPHLADAGDAHRALVHPIHFHLPTSTDPLLDSPKPHLGVDREMEVAVKK